MDSTSTPNTPRPIPDNTIEKRKKRKALFTKAAVRDADDELDSEITEVRKIYNEIVILKSVFLLYFFLLDCSRR